MAIKIFNGTETDYTGTSNPDLIVGNSLDNSIYGDGGNDIILGLAGSDFIDGGDGDDIIFGGDGDDIIFGGDGNNIILGGAGDDTIETGDGEDYIDGGDGIDNIFGGAGDDTLYGGSGNDVIYGGDGDDVLSGGEGNDYLQGDDSSSGDETVQGNLFLMTSYDVAIGGDGNDTFRIGNEEDAGHIIIEGGVSGLDNSGNEARYIELSEADETDEDAGLVAIDTTTGEIVAIDDDDMSLEAETDVRLNIVTRPGSSAISTFATTIAGYNAVDTLEFTKSGEFEDIVFSGIERIELASGVHITLEAEQLEENGESLSTGEFNPGTHIYGVAGGPVETVTVELEFEDATFTPAATIVGATPVTYEAAVFEVDDYSVANLYHNVDVIYDASEGEAGSYTRIDGANEGSDAHEIVYGGDGVEYVTMRLGDDTVYGNGGNDLLIGHGGADYLDGGEGDDIFVIGGFGSGVQGTTSKVDDGNKEWIATGAKHDVIVGGDGVDTLRITTGIGANTKANGTVVLNDANFQSMEVVQVGGTVGRLNVENTDLQLLNDHYYFKANGTVADLSNTLGNNGGTINNVVVDASGVTTNGLRFEGNADQQTFIGTSKADVFIGNGGNDTLTGGGGADTFVFGKVYEQVVTGSSTTVQTYTNTAFNLTGVDTITDFTRGTDKIELHLDQYSQLAGFNASMLRVNSTGTAQDANDYLVYNTTTHTLSYDADGNGSGAAVDIAVLTGVNTVSTSDFIIA
ncbi:Hemolysin-type calcium-binding repeat-containing protein [Methylophilus rhizosphaerae]|uniref:Hemolysin-type calcium-binding repeat-containing protein n=2 Tax=Methylophilus rhizosphaerae TaxID=492660 RepID=A0A1G8ZGA5_9PROT|nr:Hemolysin-type calcium-binding repeat-containing protein [Methylophilus rhizosphaerae]